MHSLADRLRRLLAMLPVLLAAALLPPAAGAHPMPQTQAWIDTRPDGLTVTLHLPLDRLEIAFGRPLAEAPEQLLERKGEALSLYLLQHVGARGTPLDAPGWQVLRPRLTIVGRTPSAELHAQLQLRAPAGSDPRAVRLHLDTITHELQTHIIQVFLRNDWAAGQVSEPPRLLGQMTADTVSMSLPLDTPRTGAAWLTLLAAGMHHIADGTDHLLFLLLLLLVAPLEQNERRWQGARPARQAIWSVVRVVSAFTVGHSLTLMLGGLGWLRLDVQPVEIAVALTLVIAALHAWRPLLRNGEIGMALLFGLIHGMAFSASLSGAGLTLGQHVQALLAFNLGIEAMQLLLVLLVMPVLLWLAAHQTRTYGGLRSTLSLLSVLIATGWVLERSGADLPPSVLALMTSG